MPAFSDPIKPGVRCEERFDGILLRKVKNKITEEKIY